LEGYFVTSQELQSQVLQLPLHERWQLVQQILASIQQETTASGFLPLTDSAFQHIHYRTGSSGEASPVLKGTRIRVQTLAIAWQQWNWEPSRIAQEYDLSEAQVSEALRFYELHKAEIEAAISEEIAFAAAHVQD
jgi:uncharacterized protein (DUF433 family)